MKTSGLRAKNNYPQLKACPLCSAEEKVEENRRNWIATSDGATTKGKTSHLFAFISSWLPTFKSTLERWFALMPPLSSDLVLIVEITDTATLWDKKRPYWFSFQNFISNKPPLVSISYRLYSPMASVLHNIGYLRFLILLSIKQKRQWENQTKREKGEFLMEPILNAWVFIGWLGFNLWFGLRAWKFCCWLVS